MIRLDKYISKLARYSRSELRKLLKKGEVFVDNNKINDGGIMVQDSMIIRIFETHIEVKENVTIILHKPSGYVCSNINEGGHLSWKHLIKDCPYHAMLEIAGRLDFDTEGLVVATSDGQLAHRLISPKWKLPKTYYIKSKNPLHPLDCKKMEEGIILDDGYKTMKASCKLLDKYSCRLMIYEGKYHQIKRMLETLDNKVIYLKREKFGERNIESLPIGQWKYI